MNTKPIGKHPRGTSYLWFFVEEPSMEAFLRASLPKLFPEIFFDVIVFRGKRDMKKKIGRRLNAYANSALGQDKIFVLMDRDHEDCHQLKESLEQRARKAGLRTRSQSPSDWQLVNRIVIEQLEGWYFGCWEAVCVAYPKADPAIPKKRNYRNPDQIRNVSKTFERVMQKQRYFPNGLNKVAAADCIGACINKSTQITSRSFHIFLRTVQEVA